MSPDTIARLNDEFAEFPMMRSSGQPSEAEIAQAERQIGIPFSDDYREFLLLYGGAMVGAYPIFGLRPVEVMGNDNWSVLDITERYRLSGVHETHQWVIFSEDHSGNPIGMNKNGNIFIYDHDFGGMTALAKDFEACVRGRFLKLPDSGS